MYKDCPNMLCGYGWIFKPSICYVTACELYYSQKPKAKKPNTLFQRRKGTIMKTTMKKRIPLILALMLTLTMFSTGCGWKENQTESTVSTVPSISESQSTVQTPEYEESTKSEAQTLAATELIVRFGDMGEAFTI